MTVISGQECCVLLKNSNHVGLLVKCVWTLVNGGQRSGPKLRDDADNGSETAEILEQTALFGESNKTCSISATIASLMYSGLCRQRAIKKIDCGLLPTAPGKGLQRQICQQRKNVQQKSSPKDRFSAWGQKLD